MSGLVPREKRKYIKFQFTVDATPNTKINCDKNGKCIECQWMSGLVLPVCEKWLCYELRPKKRNTCRFFLKRRLSKFWNAFLNIMNLY